MRSFELAWKYILHNRLKSLILVACIFLTALLPIALRIFLWQFDKKIAARADRTPAVIGAKGSDLDLTLSTLYFKSTSIEPVPYSAFEAVQETGLAQAVPIHAMFTARKHALVGTSLDYFRFRNLLPQAGRLFTTLGDCVLGSQAAANLGVEVGDQIITDRADAIGLSGRSALKLTIVGVLAPSRTPDDHAVFVDVKTAWVAQGLGHGHDDLADQKNADKWLSRTDKQIVANAAVTSYIEITPNNIGSFHFHGDTSDFPITAVIAISENAKDETLLQGRMETDHRNLQFVLPAKVVRELMDTVFQVNQFFVANAALVALSTLLLLVLVVVLSRKLRHREMETMFKIGCSRSTIFALQASELTIIFGVAIALLGLAAWGVWVVSGGVVEALLVAR